MATVIPGGNMSYCGCLPSGFVLHPLRHTFGTRLGESAADASKS
jgi:hypothetical protein